MTEKEIRQVIQMTVKELRQGDRLKNAIAEIYESTSDRLRAFYGRGKQDVKLQEALDQLRNDVYFRIIPMYYLQGQTIESISHNLQIDTTTVVRNKKRLCLEIYSFLDEDE